MNRRAITVLSLLVSPVGCSPAQLGDGSDLVRAGQKRDAVIHVVRPHGVGSGDERRMESLPGAPRAIYLDREGRTFTGGWDDSAQGVSSVVEGQGRSSATIPRLPWSDADWSSFVSCVADEYGRFDVAVTDVRPQTGPYIEAAVGGTGAELGFPDGVEGVAPVDTSGCRPIASAVVFIFAGATWGSPREACEVAAQEIGHAIVPLDHELLASDPMTYLDYTGHKTFQDQNAQCGEYQARSCFCGRSTQNSVQLLYSTLGAKGAMPSPPDAGQPPPMPGSPPPDTTAPTVTVLAPGDGATLPANAPIEVSVSATDDSGVAGVSLYWAFTGSTLPCDGSVAGVSCSHSGAKYTWRFQVGSGARQFYAVATDAAGNRGQSATVHVTLGAGAPAPMSGKPPVLQVDGPADGSVLHAGDPLIISAHITDDGTVTEAFVDWTRGNTTTSFPMNEVSPGIWRLDSSISTSAVAGPRSYVVRATDDRGLTTTTPVVSLSIQ